MIHDEKVTVTEQDGSTPAAAVYMLNSGDSLTLNITPDPKLGLWYVKVDGEKVPISDRMASMEQTLQGDGKDHVIEAVSRVPINIEESKWNWDSYRGKTASYYTQHSVHKFYDLPDRFESDFDAPEEGYTQTLLSTEGTAIGDDERILVGNKYNVRVTHLGTEKYAPLNVTYNDVLNLGKCKEPPGRPVVYGKVGCKQSDLATTSYLQDYYYDDGSMVGTEIYDHIPVTLEWLDPDKTYEREGYFFAKATIYAAEDLDESLALYYDVDNGGSLKPGCQIDPDDRLRSTQVVVLPADEASLIKLQTSDASGGTVSGQGVYKNSTQVTVTATPNTNEGYVFQGWYENGTTGNLVSTEAAYTFTASVDRTLTAKFGTDPEYLVRLKVDGEEGCGTVSGAGNYKEDPHSATVSAEANEGYYFIGWYDEDGEKKGEQTECTFAVPYEGITLTAKFGIDFLTKAEQAQKNFRSALNNNKLSWATLEQAVDAYQEANTFVTSGDGKNWPNAQERFDTLTAYYQNITALNLSNQDLSDADLAELDFFTGVTDLNLSGNKGVTSLSNLPNMALKTLDLSGTGVSDLSSLTGLTALETLNLSNTRISDLTALKSLTALETLDISNTGVTKLDSLITEGKSSFPGCKSLTAKDLTLTSISALEKLVSAEDFNADSVTKWDFSDSTLPATEENRNDVATIQTTLDDKFLPPTIQTSEPETPPVTPVDPVTPVIPSGPDEDDEDDGYSVSVPASSSIRGGSITVSPRKADKGDTVTITVKPDDGYELDELTVADSRGREVELTGRSGGRYTFTMPASNVKIQVSFREIAAPAVNPFTDVSTGAYYYDAVLWAVESGVTNGTTATTFSPNVTVTRAQMVTFLWRAHGSPRATGSNPFTDVNAGAYYYDAVLWAVANGITNGTTATTFSPNAPVTRAQAVTFQWRAAGAPAVSGGSFADVAADAYYAGAVSWAVAGGITNGTTATTFSPNTPVSRAQAVTFLYRELA